MKDLISEYERLYSLYLQIWRIYIFIFHFMKKLISIGALLLASVPLVSSALESTSGPMSASQREYIMKLNCDTFTWDTKSYCLEKKKQALSMPDTTTPPPASGSANPGQSNTPPPPPPRPEEPRSTPPMSQSDRDYILRLDCYTFSWDTKSYCLEK